MGRAKKVNYEVTMILPEDTSELESKFAEVMANIVTNKLSNEELGVFIEKLEQSEKDEL